MTAYLRRSQIEVRAKNKKLLTNRFLFRVQMENAHRRFRDPTFSLADNLQIYSPFSNQFP